MIVWAIANLHSVGGTAVATPFGAPAISHPCLLTSPLECASTDTHYAGERGGKEEKRGGEGGGGGRRGAGGGYEDEAAGPWQTASAECSRTKPKPQQNAKKFPSTGFA